MPVRLSDRFLSMLTFVDIERAEFADGTRPRSGTPWDSLMPIDVEQNPVAADILYGAAELARFLRWPVRNVYQARERGLSIPIRKREGVGIYAFKSELVAWLKAEETLPQPVRRITILPSPKLLVAQAEEHQAGHEARVKLAREDAERATARLRAMKRQPSPKASS